MVGLLIRLKFALQRHTPGGMRLFALALTIGGAALTWYVALAAGTDAARSELWMLAAALWAVGWILGPTLANGTGVLRSQYFTLLPLDGRRLGGYLLITVFVGVGPAVTLVALLSLTWHALALDPAAWTVAVVGAVLLWVLLITLSRLVFRALGAAMRTRLGMEIASVQWGLFLAGLFFGWMAVQMAFTEGGDFVREGLGGGPVAQVLAALPTSWPVLAVEAAVAGSWGLSLFWLAALAVVTAVVVVLTSLLLAPSVSPRGVRRRSRPLGARPVTRPGRGFSLLPDTPLGAVVGKEMRQWWRDPWRGLELRASLWAALFMGLLTWWSGMYAFLAPFAGVGAAMVMALATANLYAQDGTALWMTVVGQDRGTARADVRGRQIAILLLIAPGATLLSALFVVGTGEHWAWPAVITGMVTLFGVGSGLALLSSVVMLTPGVDPQLRVDANDTGDNQVQVWTLMLCLPLASSPAVAATIFLYVVGMPWLAVLVGAANGFLVAWLLGRIAYRRLEARLPETFTRMRYGKQIARQAVPENGGWLDRLEHASIEGNEETRPRGS